ncbi:MAG TPA: HupE/UreJ family protein, partial [Steroidobacteraceae bacterium]|nr:HupE/UreJ family protein [Steroidobacteraceae bacterium]
VFGVLGIPLPFIELAISLSAVLLGLVVLLEYRAPLVLAAVLVSVFAIFHGYAHGAELPGAVNPLAYGVGFVIATGLLHLTGILIGLLVHWQWGHWVVRASGAIVAAVGVYFLVGNIGLRA